MGIYRKFTYNNNGTEIDFMQGLIDLICGLGDGITCEDTNGNPTTAAEQYADLTSASKAEFVLNFGGNAKLTIQRSNTNNQYNQYFTMKTSNVTVNNIACSWDTYLVMQETARAFNITYYKSDNLIMLWIGWYNRPNITDTSISFIVLKANNDVFCAANVSYNAFTQTFYGSDMTVTYSPLFQYAAEAGKIDYVDHAPFISGGTKQFDTGEIFSCSIVSQFASITLPNRGNFYAIGTNALVPIDDE